MSNTPWTRNQKLILGFGILTLVFGLLGKIEVRLQYIQNKVNSLETQLLEVKTDALIRGDLQVGGNATTTGTQVVGRDTGRNTAACLGLRTVDGQWVYAYATSAQSILERGLVWSRTDCFTENDVTGFTIGQ